MRALMSAGALLTAVTLAACGGGTEVKDSTDIHGAAVYAAQCMRAKGYNLPDPTFDDDGVPQFQEPTNLRGDAAYEAAWHECNRRLNEAWAAAGRPNRKEEDRQGLLVFARCMREKGVDVSDPDAQGNWPLDKQLLASPGWRRAAQACRDMLPAGAKLPAVVDPPAPGGKR
jgi:hypothetical protein